MRRSSIPHPNDLPAEYAVSSVRVDVVNGTIIGEMTFRAQVITPRGTQQGQDRFFENETDAREWAEQTRKDAITEVGPVCAKWLGWDGQWEVRFSH